MGKGLVEVSVGWGGILRQIILDQVEDDYKLGNRGGLLYAWVDYLMAISVRMLRAR